jgi:hypothetical protein
VLFDPKWEVKVDPKIAILRKWVEAMQSGEYKQCFGVAVGKNKDSYCALGVLLKSAGEPLYEPDSFLPRYSRANTLLAPIGMNVAQVFALNDGDRLTFPEIAKVIAARL